jgi:hypothetical protein
LGARGAKASLKIALGISVFGRLPLVARLMAGHRHDMLVFPPLEAFRNGTLWLFDKGFVTYDRLRDIDAAGQFFLCPMRLNGNAGVVRVRSAPAPVRKMTKRGEAVSLRGVLPSAKRISRSWDLDVVVWPKTTTRLRRPVHLRGRSWAKRRATALPHQLAGGALVSGLPARGLSPALAG